MNSADQDIVVIDDDLHESEPQSIVESIISVLIVDDDDDVHKATNFALEDRVIAGKSIKLLHAFSGAQAVEMMRATPDIAVILLDVVMEEDDAGLKVVQTLRSEGFLDVRIILRTGHAGYAPESQVIRDYDINDYHTKGELTQTRLITVLTAAIRNYLYIQTLAATRKGLQLIIKGTQTLYKNRNLDQFSTGVLTQIAALLDLEPQGAICAVGDRHGGSSPDQQKTSLIVLSGVGRFRDHVGMDFTDITDMPDEVKEILKSGPITSPCIGSGWLIMNFTTKEGQELFVYFEHAGDVDSFSLSMLEMFSSHISLCFENIAILNVLDELAFIDQRMPMPNHNAYIRHLSMIFESNEKIVHSISLISVQDILQYSVEFGIGFSEKIISSIVERIESILGKDAFVARTSEFRICVIHAPGDHLASGLEKVFVKPFVIEGSSIRVNAKIGLVLDLEEFGDAESADRALQTVFLDVCQSRDENFKVYETALENSIQNAVRLRSDFEDALQNERIEFYFQPQVDAGSGDVKGVEMLARWRHDGNYIAPDIFIPVAEKAGLCAGLTFLAVKHAGVFLARRRALLLPPLTVSINLSFYDISTFGFIDVLLRHVSDAGIAPTDLRFEITESSAMQRPEEAVRVLTKLVDLGFTLSLDDFGTGYSSLSYLDRLPVHELKIDRSFVASLSRESARKSIAASANSIGRNLLLNVVAEGVETPLQHELLSAIGVKMLQGFLYGKPMPADQFLDWEGSWDLAKVTTHEH